MKGKLMDRKLRKGTGLTAEVIPWVPAFPYLGLLGLFAAVWLLIAGAAGAAEQPHTASVDSLGSVRSDTLYVTLDKITHVALVQNEMLAASAAMTDVAKAEALTAWKGFLPRITLGEFFVRSDNALNSFAFKLNKRSVDPMNDFSPDGINNPPIANQFNTQVMLMQPIFNGGMGFNGKRAADAAAKAATYNHQRASETVVFQAVQAYQGLALAKAFEVVMLASVASAEGHVRQAQAMVDAEMATAADLLRAQVQLSALRQKLIEVRNLMAVAGEHIKLLTATATPLPLAPARPLAMSADTILRGNLDLSRVAGRSDLQANRLNVEAAGKMVGVAWGAVIPHINLSAQRDLFGDNIFSDDARSWSVGVYGTWNIFSGLENIGNLKKAKAEVRAASHMYDFEMRQAQLQATQAWLDVKAAKERVEVAQDAVEAARESLRIVTNQYREGLATMVDLLDTQAATTMTEGSLVQALHDYNVGLARLRYAGVTLPTTEG